MNESPNLCPLCFRDDRVEDITPECCIMCDRPWTPEQRTYDCGRCHVTWVEKPGADAKRRALKARSA